MAQPEELSRTRSRPRRAVRVRYAYSDTEEELLPKQRSQPARATRRVQSYREESDDHAEDSSSEVETDPNSDSDLSAREALRQTLHRTHGTAALGTTTQTRKRKAAPARPAPTFASFKRRKVSSAQNARLKQKPSPLRVSPVVPHGRIPPWQTLPYHILASVVKYAAYPLYEKASRSTPSISWLCATSTLCRSFHEACLAALLYSPPLYPSHRAHGLLMLLRRDQDSLTTNYRNKIKCLDVEVKHLLIRKSGIDLSDLLTYTPLLERLRLYHNHDDFGTLIWAQPSASKDRWAYPAQLFESLDHHHLVLKSFEWNGRFPRPMDVLHTMLEVHSRPSFSQLRELSCMNLTLSEKATDEDVESARTLLTAALQKLPSLRRLAFRNCGVIDELTLPHLPTNLQHLELGNCQSVTSSALEQYLTVGGTSLRTLTLRGNQSMSLGFLASLKTFCPQLRVVDIDLSYTDPTSYRDREPLYDELLPDGPPTWPPQLEQISIENLRQLSASEAEDFFASLVSASEDLPFLKVLNIKAILKDASWRDRAEIRKKWLPKLEAVFLNNATPVAPSKRPAKESFTPSQRQSTRIANHNLRRLTISADDSDSASHSSSSLPPAVTRQGRCDVVNLVISDQRPSQEQYHEDDFLDDEPSDDEEWTGRNEVPTSSGYAW